jgi:serine/threonine protein kinase
MQDRLRIAHEVASALEYMHSAQPPLVHLNVKPANILLTPQMLAKVSLSACIRHLTVSQHSRIGHTCYHTGNTQANVTNPSG